MWRLTLALACLISAGSMLGGCDKPSQDGNSPAGKEKVKIGFLVKQAEEPWFQHEWKFADQAAAKYGFDVVKIAAPDGDKVLTAIDNLAAQGAKGFIICTPDVRLGPAIVAKAKANDLKLFSVDDRSSVPTASR